MFVKGRRSRREMFYISEILYKTVHINYPYITHHHDEQYEKWIGNIIPRVGNREYSIWFFSWKLCIYICLYKCVIHGDKKIVFHLSRLCFLMNFFPLKQKIGIFSLKAAAMQAAMIERMFILSNILFYVLKNSLLWASFIVAKLWILWW